MFARLCRRFSRTLAGGLLGTVLAGAMVLLPGAVGTVRADSYEAALPPELHTSPRMCDYVPCREVMPGADSFSERRGQPPFVEAYKTEGGEKKLVGYVMLSTDIVDIPAYSGKPVVTLIGMDTAGRFAGVKILKHSEPILLLGIPESALIKFNEQYLGKFVGDQIEIGKARPEESIIGLDAITGATVTVIAQNQVMMVSGGEVAKQVGILKPQVRPPATFIDTGETLTWDQLVAEGSIARLTVKPQDVGLVSDGRPYVDLWFGLLNVPTVGRSILGKDGYERLMSGLHPGEQALFVIKSDGIESFKGSGFVRGGLYDRVQVRQERDTYTFRDLDYLNLYGVSAAGAPSYTESAIFIVRGKTFSAAYPWQFVFLANKLDKSTGAKTFANFDREVWLPARYLEGGRPVVKKPDAPWLKMWKDRAWQIAGFVVLLIAVATVYARRDALVRRASRKNKWPVNAFKYTGWVVSIGFVGFYAMAQPSITQVLTWFHSLLFQWKWELFLSDPFIFIFWVFIIVTVFLWGRGLFCGWLCPFGSLSELLYKVGERIGLKRFQRQLPKALHDKLKWLKYAIFLGLLAVSFFSMPLAEKLAEVEPFKTTFLVGLFNRSWPYTLFAAGLLGLSIFVERPFCKYLCPLGASLAMPTTFRWFGLKRKQECTSCNACAHGCGSQAIDKDGRIDQRECLLCLDCMVLYHDDHACPPLVQERKRRTKAGQPLTPIGQDGYFIPIIPVPAAPLKETTHG
ncbi:NosR/NirI family transcriptional regulator, nitrous oxide reductase regulator [Oryzomicrobium terrae]|uniref:NosR/NirI family transcriptional regulator, nitrous oxide reductase regulator n=2 Tax=Oryzomicrobium terrae TaxID=1735038 RepID=A0A5C1ECV6_9RHOO|nr:NosR/NirI family transcriptional regulator, nitrous oxide reductase regulator [Oryzomicrobium terrae]